jgi:hypothetical protein
MPMAKIGEQPDTRKVAAMPTILLWRILLVLCRPSALLAIVLYPVAFSAATAYKRSITTAIP